MTVVSDDDETIPPTAVDTLTETEFDSIVGTGVNTPLVTDIGTGSATLRASSSTSFTGTGTLQVVNVTTDVDVNATDVDIDLGGNTTTDNDEEIILGLDTDLFGEDNSTDVDVLDVEVDVLPPATPVPSPPIDPTSTGANQAVSGSRTNSVTSVTVTSLIGACLLGLAHV